MSGYWHVGSNRGQRYDDLWFIQVRNGHLLVNMQPSLPFASNPTSSRRNRILHLNLLEDSNGHSSSRTYMVCNTYTLLQEHYLLQ